MRLFLLTIFFLCQAYSWAQNADREKLPKPVTIKGEKFYLHPIEKGTTLYSVGKQYGITLEDLKKANENVVSEMRIGDTLRIPLKAIEVLKQDQEQSDGNFLIHEVQKSNTLYSIAKEYDLEIAEILAANPEVEEQGLKNGMRIKIPVAKLKAEPQLDGYVEPSPTSPFITHRVMPKETLYSLSKSYAVTIDSILAINDGLKEGLKVNQLITIPILKDYSDSVKLDIVFDSSAIKADYVISLLLPFYLDEMHEADDTSSIASQRLYQQLYNKSQYAIDFYHGFKLAADSLSKKGLRLELKVFDTANDTAKIAKLIKDSALVYSDLIVGPLYYDNFVMVADYAKKEGIHIVSPVKQSNKILLGYSNVSKVMSSDHVLHKSLGKYLADSLSTYNLIFVFPDHIKERSQVDLIKRTYFSRIEEKGDSVRYSIPKELIWDDKSYSVLKSKLDSSKRNILIAPSEEQAFVTSLMTQLNSEEDFKITLIGLEDWKNYDYLEVEYLHKLDVHLMAAEHMDLNSEDCKAFEARYFDQFDMPAAKFSYLGFDVAMYYLNLLNNYGTNYDLMLLGYQDEFLSRKFKFFKTGIESGFENHSVYLLRYRDYQLQKVY